MRKWISVVVAASLSIGMMPVGQGAVAKTAVQTSGYTISKKAGTYKTQAKPVLKAKKGYQVFYTTKAKFTVSKKLASLKKKTFTFKKTTSLKVIAVKSEEKVTAKQLNGKSYQKKVKAYTYQIKKAAKSTQTPKESAAPKNTEPPEGTSEPVFQIENGVLLGGEFGDAKTVVIPDGVTKIADHAFEFNNTIENVIFPEGLKEIGESAFNECTRLKKVRLSNTVEKIGDYAFFQCTTLKKIGDSEALEKIGEGAFYGCCSLTDIGITDSVTSVGEYAFGDCDSMEFCYIGSGLTEIPSQLFVNCDRLDNVTIPENIQKINSRAFHNCMGLKKIEFSGSLEEIGEHAFSDCGELGEISVSAKSIGKSAFENAGITSISLKEGCENIEDEAFTGCMNLEKILLPASMKKLGENLFYTSALQKIEITEGNPVYDAVDGVLYTKDHRELVSYPKAKKEEEFQIPDGVEKVGDYAFTGADNIKRILLPSGIKEFGNHAFDSTAFTEVKIPDGLESIGEKCFSGNGALHSIVLPDSIKQMGVGAFSECYELEQAELGVGVAQLPESAFAYDSHLKKIICHGDLEKIGPNAFYSCTGLDGFQGIQLKNKEKLTIRDNMILSADGKILWAYFEPAAEEETETKQVTEFTVPAGVEVLEKGSLAHASISTLIIPASVKKIEERSFGYTDFQGYPVGGTAIIGEKGSAAEQYARKNDIAFFTGAFSQNIKEVSLKRGESRKFEISGIAPEELLFTSGNKNVVSVDKTGKITAKAKGTTSVTAAVGTKYFSCKVTVTDGDAPKADSGLSGYRYVDESELKGWEKQYFNMNRNLLFDEMDFPAIHTYSTSEYEYIVGTYFGEGSSYFESKVAPVLGKDYGQYKKIGENLSKELRTAKLQNSLIAYSGTNNLSVFTGGGSTLGDMMGLVGKKIKDISVISTSLDHSTANAFGSGMLHTVLEIYIDKEDAPGMYIADFSRFPSEVEFLLDRNVTYEFLDAGVRVASTTKWYVDGTETIDDEDMRYERFIKMKISHS